MAGRRSSNGVGGVVVHTYTGGEDGFLVNTHVVEGPRRLVVFDAQFLRPYAHEAANMIEAIGKPVERIIITEGHPDHWFGAGVLHERFPTAPVFALEGVRNYVRDTGPAVLAARRATLGDVVPERTFAPTRVLGEGEETIDSIRFRFEKAIDAESAGALITTLPEGRSVFLGDIVYRPNLPPVIVPLNLPEPSPLRRVLSDWIGLVRAWEARADAFNLILVGHGDPLDRAGFRRACAATAEYLITASDILTGAPSADAFAARMKMEFADRDQHGWIDLSANQLFAAGRPI
ncbi:MAG TPA: MBL fold metallo-hydrolase [bacterium]|nr:MBL fold metallo-hydrolase [bacterium]